MSDNANNGTAPPPAKRARGNHAKTGGISKGRGSGSTGKLAGFMHMPMDIFFEIASRSHPLDLLHISRTSKQLHSVILSRKSRFVWTASLAGVDDLPPCPEGMTEPAYSALLFDRVCNLCGVRSSWVDYAIRLRLCPSCRKSNILTGKEILPDMDHVTQRFLMALVPCETGKNVAVAVHLERPLTHAPDDKYYAPQLRRMTMLPRKFRAQRDDETALDYMDDVFSNSAKAHVHATALLRWEAGVALKRQKEEDALKARRKASIAEKVKDLGYAEVDFPSTKDWAKLADQPKELTDRIWNNIKAKIIAMLQEEKERRTQAAYASRLEARFNQISAYYNETVELMSPAQRALMPNLFNFHRLPSIAALARQNDAQGDVTRDDFLALTTQILQEVEVYKTEAKAAAFAILRRALDYKPTIAGWKEDLENLSADEALTRQYALFGCHMPSHPWHQNPYHLTFEQMHDHWRTDHPDAGWVVPASYEGHSIRKDVWCSGEYGLGGKMLDSAGLPRNMPMAVLTGLIRAGRLYCSCGDPAMPPPEEMDWPKLFTHVTKDLAKFEKRRKERTRVTSFNLILRSHHPLTGPDACIKLLPEGADTAPARARAAAVDLKTRRMIEDRLALQPTGPRSIAVCRLCKALTARTYWKDGIADMELPETQARIVHHLRGWHGKEFQKRDILFYEK